MCAKVVSTIIKSHCYGLKFTFIKPFCIAIEPANKHTKLITINQPNCIAFSITIRSADRQTKLITDRISVGSSKLNSISCTQPTSISDTVYNSVYSAIKHAELVTIIKTFSCSQPLSVINAVYITYISADN